MEKYQRLTKFTDNLKAYCPHHKEHMTKDDIIRMALESGLFVHKEVQPEIERFAGLVAAAEREACAKVCEGLVPNSSRQSHHASVWDIATFDCATAIRARGELK